MIKVKKLVKSFGSGENELIVLKGLDFQIKQGEFVAITGRSGSGKSTLLYQLGLLDRPKSGEVWLDGVELANSHKSLRTDFRLFNLGYIFHDYALIPTLTATENVMMPLLMQGKTFKFAEEIAAESLARVGLADKLKNLPSQLSGGQQQRVSIARAIAHSPKIVFADEPTANLDSEASENILDIFMELNKTGQTMVMVTHEPDYAALADRVITLSDGTIVADERGRKARKKVTQSRK